MTGEASVQTVSPFDKDEDEISYEQAITKYGMGRYQIIIAALVGLSYWSICSSNEAYLWIGASMPHKCRLPDGSDVADNNTQRNDILGKLVFISSPDECTYSEVLLHANSTNITIQSDIPCTAWSYEQTYFTSTIMSEWDLNQCGGKWLISTAAAIGLLGYLTGCYVFGFISDRYGRMKTLSICFVGMLACGLASTYSVNIIMLMIAKFIFAMFAAGANNSGAVYVAEILPSHWRAYNGPLIAAWYMTLSIINTAIAQGTTNWRDYQLICSLICIPFIPYVWILHESPAWLLSKGYEDRCLMYFKRSAQTNGKSFPQNLRIINKSQGGTNEDEKKPKINLFDLVRTPTIRFITLGLSVVWFLSSVTSIGLTYQLGNMPGNMFINSYITLAGTPLVLLLFPLVKRGRRFALLINYSLCVVVLAIMAGLTFARHLTDTMRILTPILCGLGRVFIIGNFSVLYTYTPEYFPTYMRVTALGVCSSFSRIGSALAPYIILLRGSFEALPYIIIGGACFVTVLNLLLLPETSDNKLFQTIEEVEQTYKDKVGWECCRKDNSKSEDKVSKHEEIEKYCYSNEIPTEC